MDWPSDCWCADLGPDAAVTSTQTVFRSNFTCCLWKSALTGIDENRNYIGQFTIRPFHDGKSFLLKIWGEFWGNTPKEHFRIDFEAPTIQADLAAAEAAYCDAWLLFGVKAAVGQNIGHWQENIWWNATIPFKDHDELVSDAFSQKLRGSLAAVANAFASLLKYRVPVNP